MRNRSVCRYLYVNTEIDDGAKGRCTNKDNDSLVVSKKICNTCKDYTKIDKTDCNCLYIARKYKGKKTVLFCVTIGEVKKAYKGFCVYKTTKKICNECDCYTAKEEDYASK